MAKLPLPISHVAWRDMLGSTLGSLKLSRNHLNGSIAFQIGNLAELQNILDLSCNLLTGEISPQIGKLHMLETLNISYDKLTGSIPSSLEDMLSLTLMDLSYNNLVRNLPNSKAFQQGTFVGNEGLCGKAQGLQSYNSSPIKRNAKGQRNEMNKDLFSIWNWDGCISYKDIINTMEDFDDKYCIREGGYGRVYKASLPTGIVKLYGFCSHRRCMFLVYEYMESGILANILNSEEGAMELDWVTRVNIIKAVAHSSSYMQHDCDPPIVHRDISSKNVLLDSEFEANVSDFGTARLLMPDSSNWTELAGTYGYVAPG
ncbi:MDIS1-interacting receptor like kinase 2-like [Tasmannia lanceolata]|uniref:MDIS1-interacting receptor like kinase 2-like n=1 Tax=Tasmannia lanceolata TaxID=3420 RepID=UPI004063E875